MDSKENPCYRGYCKKCGKFSKWHIVPINKRDKSGLCSKCFNGK